MGGRRPFALFDIYSAWTCYLSLSFWVVMLAQDWFGSVPKSCCQLTRFSPAPLPSLGLVLYSGVSSGRMILLGPSSWKIGVCACEPVNDYAQCGASLFFRMMGFDVGWWRVAGGSHPGRWGSTLCFQLSLSDFVRSWSALSDR